MAVSSTSAKPPAGFSELQRSEFSRVFGLAVDLRLAVSPVAAVLAVALAAWEGVPWRWGVLGAFPLTLVVFSVVESRRFRRLGLTQFAIELNLLLAVLGQLGLSFATGGVESPLMPLLLVLAFFWALIVTGRPWYDGGAALAQLGAPWAFAAVAMGGQLPDFNLRLFGGGPRGGHDDLHLLVSAAILNLGTVIARRLGHSLRGVFDGILFRSMQANDALRREYHERSESLVAMTAELAHELKNPLASVKGLATLLSQNVDPGKGAERLAVLRGEVDRMQDVLGEVLTFSRPLLPLSVAPAELGALCRQVVALHEGLSREKGVEVALELRGEVKVRCDVGRVRQILINLLQNALDVSPRGAEVTLRCDARAEGATLRVLDRGAGLSAEVLARLFQPGVTTKPRGNGLGLAVARSLARQHGGEVLLEAREGGGCVASLTLPLQPPGEGPS